MKITLTQLKRIIREELSKVGAGISDEVDAKEVDADEFADSLENHVDFVKLLKLKELKQQKKRNLSRYR